MHTRPEPTWQSRFELTTCAAADLEQSLPVDAVGVAVVYTKAEDGEKTFLVIESRAGSLRAQCLKRLRAAKLPPLAELTVSFKTETLPDTAAATLDAVCRRQVILAAELRRELRPAMR